MGGNPDKPICLPDALTVASFPLFLLVAYFVPFDRLPSMCVFLNYTGLPCPSCGMTRSVMAMAHLNFSRAAHLNPLGIVFLLSLGVWWVNAVCQIATGRRTRLSGWAGRHLGLLIALGSVLFVGYGTVRIWLIIHGLLEWPWRSAGSLILGR